jgi:hypothetical protein
MRWMAALTVVASGLALQGCAESTDPAPSYLGFAPSIAESAPLDQPATPSKVARHISSNKVLGAMAFQKTTGRTVDPGRLSEQH